MEERLDKGDPALRNSPRSSFKNEERFQVVPMLDIPSPRIEIPSSDPASKRGNDSQRSYKQHSDGAADDAAGIVAGPGMFGFTLPSLPELPGLPNLKSLFEEPRVATRAPRPQTMNSGKLIARDYPLRKLSDTEIGPHQHPKDGKPMLALKYNIRAKSMLVYDFSRSKMEQIRSDGVTASVTSPDRSAKEEDIRRVFMMMDYRDTGFLSDREMQVLTKLMGLGFKCGDMDSLFVFMNTNLHPQGIHLQQALDFAVTCNLELKAPVEALQRVYDQFCLVDLNRHGFIKVPEAHLVLHKSRIGWSASDSRRFLPTFASFPSVDITELFNLLSERHCATLTGFRVPLTFDFNLRTGWYLDRINAESGQGEVWDHGAICVFTEGRHASFHSRGQVVYIFLDPTNRHVVNFVVSSHKGQSGDEDDLTGLDFEAKVKKCENHHVVRATLYSMDRAKVMDSDLMREIPFQGLYDDMSQNLALDVEKYVSRVTSRVAYESAHAWTLHTEYGWPQVMYINDVFDLIDYGDESVLTFASFAVFMKMIGQPYHENNLTAVIKALGADVSGQISKADLVRYFKNMRVVKMPLEALFAVKDIFRSLTSSPEWMPIPYENRYVSTLDLHHLSQTMKHEWTWDGYELLVNIALQCVEKGVPELRYYELLCRVMDAVGADSSLEDILELFHMIDSDCTGRVHHEDVQVMLLAVKLSAAAVENTMSRLHKDARGEVSWVQFTMWWRGEEALGISWPWGLLHLKRAFNRVDSDGSGTIEDAEFLMLLRKFGVQCTQKEATMYMGLIDLDNSGEVSFLEFIHALAKERFRNTPVADAMSLDNISSLSAFLADLDEKALNKIMDVKGLPLLERIAVATVMQQDIKERAHKVKMMDQRGVPLNSEFASMDGAGAFLIHVQRRRVIQHVRSVAIGVAFVITCVTGAATYMFEIFAERYQTSNIFDFTASNNVYFWTLSLVPSMVFSVIEIVYVYYTLLSSAVKITYAVDLVLMPLIPRRAMMITAIAKEAMELPHSNEHFLGIDPLISINPLVRTVLLLLGAFKGGMSKFVIRVLIKRVVSRSAAKTLMPLAAVPLIALWNVLLARRVMEKVIKVVLGQKSALDILHCILMEDHLTRIHMVERSTLEINVRDKEEEDDDNLESLNPSWKTMYTDLKASKGETIAYAAYVRHLNSTWLRSCSHLEGLPMYTRHGCIRVVVQAIVLMAGRHPDIETMLRELISYFKVSPEEINNVMDISTFLAVNRKRVTSSSLCNLDVCSQLLVVRIFALCLTKTVVGYKEKQMLRRMLICCGLSQDLKQFTKTLELSKSGMAHAGLFCKLFDVNNGQDTSLEDDYEGEVVSVWTHCRRCIDRCAYFVPTM